jgi:hypothetical protein
VHASAAEHELFGAFASVEQPPHALSAGALQLTALVPLHAYVPAHPSLAVHAAPGAPASVGQPPHALSAGALHVTAFFPLHP